MKSLAAFLFLFVCTTALSQDDMAEFGVNPDATVTKKMRFEELAAKKISEKLAQFVQPEAFQVYVEVTLSGPKKESYQSSSNIQLGMLGTVANLQPPRPQTTGSKFIDRISQFKIVLYTNSDIDSDTQTKMLAIAKAQVSYIKENLVVAEVKPLLNSRSISFGFIKDYQVLWAAFFLTLVLMSGFRYMAQQLPQQMSEIYMTALPAARSQVEVLEGSPSAIAFHAPIFEEDHFFKLPLVVQQTVIGFASFSTVQEVYTLISPKYKKLFWSCLPRDIQARPESELVKQGCTIQDVEKTHSWAVLSKDVHTFVERNPDLLQTIHPEIQFYFRKNRNERAS